MLQHYADLALTVWIIRKCYLTLIFQCITAVASRGFLAEVFAAPSLKASCENEICFPKTVKTVCVCVCVCPIITHGWLRSVNYACPVKWSYFIAAKWRQKLTSNYLAPGVLSWVEMFVWALFVHHDMTLITITASLLNQLPCVSFTVFSFHIWEFLCHGLLQLKIIPFTSKGTLNIVFAHIFLCT